MIEQFRNPTQVHDFVNMYASNFNNDLIGEGTCERTETADEYFSLTTCFRPLLRRNSYADRLSTSSAGSEASSDVPS